MSLATRCTACGTIFRIVDDQLRVSDGWVRCGRCSEVFDARTLLFDMERETAPAWPQANRGRAAAAAASTREAEPDFEPPTTPEAPRANAVPSDEAGSASVAPAASPEPAQAFDSTDRMPLDDLDDGRREPHWVEPAESVDIETELPAEQTPAAFRPPVSAPASAPVEPPPSKMPDFVRKARAAERWRRPSVRLALGLVSALLVFMLGLQVTWHFHDALAALYPGTRPVIEALCQPVGCRVGPWKRTEVLSIEATALSQIGKRNAYKLNLTLHNKSAVEVATPWVELTVTDTSGAIVARRVLPPAALTPAMDRLGPEAEQSFSLSFTTGSQRVSGYTVNVFNP